jgi:ATP-dependent Clp protease ATP-binding subunit ClpB
MKKYIKEKNIDIRLTDSAKEYFAEIGFDPVYGARPLRRALQREILNPLAMKILDRTFKEGDTVEVDFEDDKIIFSKEATAEVEA